MSEPAIARMANQIARAFATRPDAEAADAVAQHILSFWDPRMRAALAALRRERPGALNPVAQAAAARLAGDQLQ